MTGAVSTIYLVESATGLPTEAELREGIGPEQVADWKTEWMPVQIATLRQLRDQGVPMYRWPQSWHWDWEQKQAGVEALLGYRGFCVVAGGLTQGLMQVNLMRTARAMEHAGKPLVYVDYVEVAPWNQARANAPGRYRGVGLALMTAAAQLSVDEEFKGRIGLHSLPQSEGFYAQICGMTDLGPDQSVQGLRYFEMNADQARKFLEE